MMRPTRHVFVCTNARDAAVGLPSCGANDGAGLLARLLSERASRGLYREIFITETRCLGICSEAGATVVVYPEAVWYVGVRAEDASEIFAQHLVGGRPVARLLDRRLS
jgi:(2Fe-2S) ferredoxin